MLSSESLHDYERDGYIVVPGLFGGEELQRLRQAADELAARVGPVERGKPRLQVEPDLDDGQLRLRMIEPVVDLSPACRDWSVDPRIVGIVEQLFGEPALLFEDKLNYKPARVGSGFPLHQDSSYWPGMSRNIVSVFVHLDDATVAQGCMQLVPGAHRRGLLAFTAPGDHVIDPSEVDASTLTTVEGTAGDALVFHCLTPHASAANRSDRDRRALILSYNPQSDGRQYRYGADLLATYHDAPSS